jgi:N-acetylglutamate synthase-like GNAT family acetyltransferase
MELVETSRDSRDQRNKTISLTARGREAMELATTVLVGTCALQKTGERQFELTKMGVLDIARGKKAGEFLLLAIIARADALGCDRLYLLSNAKSAAAIHLYEKLGFRHDAGIMDEFGKRYERCNVAMLYNPSRTRRPLAP